jgi:hypothetical protein
MKSKLPSQPNPATEPLTPMIYVLRGQRVILDADLARIYGVATFRFNEAFKRNRHRFPADFAFQLTAGEFAGLRSPRTAAHSSQIAMSASRAVESEGFVPNRSRFTTLNRFTTRQTP